MLRELLPLCESVVLTRARASACRRRPTLRVAVRADRRAAGHASSRDPQAALERARELAGPGGVGAGDGIALPDRGPAAPGRRTGEVDPVNDDGPSVLSMVIVVALIVAFVILVFFAVGYLFGKLFL